MTTDRRQRMLVGLIGEMTRRSRRRRIVRRSGTAAALVLVAGVAWLSSARSPGPITPDAPTADIRIIRHTPRTGVIRTISDDELLERLAEIRRPAGLIRTAGRTTLTAEVTDPADPENL